MKNYKKVITRVCSVVLFGLSFASHADVVLLSGNSTADLANFLTSKFSNVTEIRQGNFADFNATGTQDALNGTGAFTGAADLVIIGRTLSSLDYDNGAAAGYNALSIPVISLTSYVARETADRMGWHTLGTQNSGATLSTLGAETTITAAGASVLGSAGLADWHDLMGASDDQFNASASNGADFGSGEAWATIGTRVTVAHWDAGDAPGNTNSAGVATFPAERLLFNIDNDNGGDLNALTSAGEAALVAALSDVGGLTVAIPEPSSLALLGLGLAWACTRRRKK